MSTQDPTSTVYGDTEDPEQLRARIEQTRGELGETVSALSDKTDVKAQASAKAEEVKEKVHEVEEKAKEKAHEVEEKAKAKAEVATEKAKENPVPAVIGALVFLLLLNRFRKRRKGRRIERRRMEDALQHTLSGGLPVAAVLVDRPSVDTAA